ncbi:MAG: hypothetical protein DRH21_02945 [Deltaproteobacteria bacterium]|nr:MAG: hypothetical protein DRH21_02945 [Deltaproteobacteria bacterium]
MINFDETKACRKCLLPEPLIRLNEDHVCGECMNYMPPVLKGMAALKEEFESKEKKGDYDCMVGISGGRDSMYALYMAKKLLNLKVLAFNYNNEFVHEQAIANMRDACKNLDVDFISIVSKRNICHKIVADQLRIASSFGPGALCACLCGPCNVGGFLSAKKVALQKKIPIIIFGNSDEERLSDFLKIGKRIPFKQKITNKTAPFFIRAQCNKLLQRMEFSSSFKETMNFCFTSGNENPGSQQISGTKILSVYNYIKWDRRKIVNAIEKELGWRKPENQVSSWRFDCRLIPLVNYLWVKACGYPKAFLGYVQMIRSGTMTKKEALGQLYGTDWGEFTREMEEFLLNDLKIGQKHIDIIKSY